MLGGNLRSFKDSISSSFLWHIPVTTIPDALVSCVDLGSQLELPTSKLPDRAYPIQFTLASAFLASSILSAPIHPRCSSKTRYFQVSGKPKHFCLPLDVHLIPSFLSVTLNPLVRRHIFQEGFAVYPDVKAGFRVLRTLGFSMCLELRLMRLLFFTLWW